MAKQPKLVIYRDRGGEYRWRLISGNGKNVCSSGESFKTHRGAERAAHALPRWITEARVVPYQKGV